MATAGLTLHTRMMHTCTHPPTRGNVPVCPDGAPCLPACPVVNINPHTPENGDVHVSFQGQSSEAIICASRKSRFCNSLPADSGKKKDCLTCRTASFRVMVRVFRRKNYL